MDADESRSNLDLEGRCGTCARFVRVTERVEAHGAVSRVGDCLLGVWPSPLNERGTCPHYTKRGEFKLSLSTKNQRTATRTPKRTSPVVAQPFSFPEAMTDMDADEFRLALRQVLREELGLGEVTIAPRWAGGQVIVKPGRDGVAEKTIPIDSLFHKIVLIRDKLRVLEQKINSHPPLTAEDKVQMQQYITQCYGSLTTFNLLFDAKDEGFVGQRNREE